MTLFVKTCLNRNFVEMHFNAFSMRYKWFFKALIMISNAIINGLSMFLETFFLDSTLCV